MGDDEFGPFQRSSDSYLVRWLSGVNKIFFENTHNRIFLWVVSDVYNRKFACIVTFTDKRKFERPDPLLFFVATRHGQFFTLGPERTSLRFN